MIRTRIESLGAFLPETQQTTHALVDTMTNKPGFDLEEITGIKTRRVCDEGQDSLHAATCAARAAIERSQYSADEIDLVVACAISRDVGPGRRQFFDPSLSLLVKRELGLQNALQFDVSNACAGMMTGLHLADAMIKAGTIRRGLVVSGEHITNIARTAAIEIDQPWDPQFGSLTVGDSGAAVIVDGNGTDDDHIDYVELTTAAEYSELCIGMPSDRTPNYALYTNNAEMHKKDRVELWPRYQARFLERLGRRFENEGFDFIIHHQVGAKAIRNFSRYGGEILGCEMPAQIQCVEELGNTATTSHWVALHEHLRRTPLGARTKILMVPAASGMVTGCVSLTLSSLQV